MEEIPITGLEELEAHLRQVTDDPETPLNAKLFDEVELQLTGAYFWGFQRQKNERTNAVQTAILLL
jgi:hypothetical protein